MIGAKGPFIILGSHEPLKRHERPSLLLLGAAWTPEEAKAQSDSFRADTRHTGTTVYADVMWTDYASAKIDADEGFVDDTQRSRKTQKEQRK